MYELVADAAEARETDRNTVVMAFTSQELTAPGTTTSKLATILGNPHRERHHGLKKTQKQNLAPEAVSAISG